MIQEMRRHTSPELLSPEPVEIGPRTALVDSTVQHLFGLRKVDVACPRHSVETRRGGLGRESYEDLTYEYELRISSRGATRCSHLEGWHHLK